jgi:Tol biopolymer transport system component
MYPPIITPLLSDSRGIPEKISGGRIEKYPDFVNDFSFLMMEESNFINPDIFLMTEKKTDPSTRIKELTGILNRL